MPAESLYPALARDVRIGRLDLGGSEPSYLIQIPGRPPFKADRPLGQLLALMDGQHTLEAIAAAWSSGETAALSVPELQRYLERELIPTGVVTLGLTRAEASRPPSPASSAQPWLGPVTAVLQHLFSLPGVLVMTPVIIGAHIWLYRQFFTGPSPLSLLRMALPDWILVVVLTALAVLLHELGHLAAGRRFSRSDQPISGQLGGWVLNPLAKIPDAWRLPRHQRLVVDLGGAWLQLSFAAGLAMLYAAVHRPGIPLAVYLSEFGLLLSLLPLPGRDGAWIYRDLAGLHGPVDRGAQVRHRLRIARLYHCVATGFFVISQAMAIVLGITLVGTIGRVGLKPSAIPVAALLLALGWLEFRLIALVISLLATLWSKRRRMVHAGHV